MNKIKLKFYRNAVFYNDVYIVIGDGIRFGLTNEKGHFVSSFDVDVTNYGQFSTIKVSYMRGCGDFVSESFEVVNEVEREFAL